MNAVIVFVTAIIAMVALYIVANSGATADTKKDGYVSGTGSNEIAGFTPETARIFAFKNNNIPYVDKLCPTGMKMQEQTAWDKMAGVNPVCTFRFEDSPGIGVST